MPYENASILGKRFIRKSNQRIRCTIVEMTDVIHRPRHIEIVKIQYDKNFHGGGYIWWELETFYNEWEEV
tara:strand:+ start:2611 stop:2820 length:210 start_codon:yes stop_codon:yes gene_type:complete